MTATDPSPPVALQDQSAPSPQVISEDTLCARCEYNLRGLSVSGRCPECGLVVAASLPTRQELSPHDWRIVRDSLALIVVANIGLALILAFVLLISTLAIDSRTATWLIAVPLAILVVIRAGGYVRFAAVLRPLERSYAELDACNSIRLLANTRAALGCVPLVFAVLDGTLPPRGMIAMLLPLFGFIAFVLYCGAGCFQYSAMAYLLTVLGFRSRARRLGPSVAKHTLACNLGVFPGAALLGAGLIVSWVSYHLLLARFIRAAHRFATGSSRPA
jgi:hypothetical protein